MLYRKGNALAMRVPRLATRLFARPEDYRKFPPVLVNSLPKSGTHLLLQIARALPGTRYYGSFIAQRPSTSTRLRSQAEINRMIDRIVPGEVVPAHLHHAPETAAALAERQILHLFIHRDPVAVILSEVAYLSEMAPWNALHRRFAGLERMEDRVRLAIEGDGTPELPDAARRFAPFLAWCDDPLTICLRYEDLISPDQRQKNLRRIAAAYTQAVSASSEAAVDALVERLDRAIVPEKSHTFQPRSGHSPLQELNAANRRRVDEMFAGSTNAKTQRDLGR